MTNSSEVETIIGEYFDKESWEMYDLHKQDGIPQSMRVIIDSIISENKEVVLDIGSGPGSLLLELLENGVAKVIGMDISEDMLKIAKKRMKDRGFEEQCELIQGSFLDKEISEQPDAITFHRVLCCHPDRKGMIDTAGEMRPDLISVTIPRDWKFFKVFVFFYSLIANLNNSFRPYIHSQKKVDQQFQELGYHLKSRDKGLWWVTTIYERE